MVIPISNLINRKTLIKINYTSKSSKYNPTADTGDRAKNISRVKKNTVNHQSNSISNTNDDESLIMPKLKEKNIVINTNSISKTNVVTPVATAPNSSTLFVDMDDLHRVSISLKQKKEELLSFYDTNIKRIIYLSDNAISIPGLNLEELIPNYNKIFISLASELENLSDTLQNQILPRYDNLSNNIIKSFNAEFASQMQNILDALK